MKIGICSIIFILLCYTSVSIELEHNTSYYERITLDQNITKEVKLYQVINWFKYQADRVEFQVIRNDRNKTISGVYTFINNDRTFSTLEIIYSINELIYQDINMRMCINGNTKILSNKDAVRAMLTFLNNNNDFEYYFF